MNESQMTAALVDGARAAGFELEIVDGFAVATAPAHGDRASIRATIEELASRAGDVRALLLGRADRAQRQRFAGFVAYATEFLQAGFVQDHGTDGMITLRCSDGRCAGTARQFRARETMLIAHASDCPAERASVAPLGSKLAELVRQCERRGARIWSQGGFVIFGWPRQDLAGIPAVIADAVEELAEWGSSQDPPFGTAIEAIGDRFVECCSANRVFRAFGFGRRDAQDREISARLLQLGKHLRDFRTEPSDDSQPSIDLSAARAIVPGSGNLLVIEELREAGALVCIDELGRRIHCGPESALVIAARRTPVEDPEPPKRWSVLNGGRPSSLAS